MDDRHLYFKIIESADNKMMNGYIKKRLKLLPLLILFLSSNHYAGEQPPIHKNVAIGKKYIMAPKPNYPLCLDEKDRVQLTDGIYSQGYFWKQKSTVGWKSVRYVEITIDLDRVVSIAGVSYHTAAGRANVDWPGHIFLLVGENLNEMYYVDDLIQLSVHLGAPPPDGYSKHRFWTDELAASGRFVKLIICPQGPFAFADEIEVYQGDAAPAEKPAADRRVEDVQRFLNWIETAPLIQRRLTQDLAAVQTVMKKMEENEQWKKEVAAIEKEIPSVKGSPNSDFRTVLPLNELHKKIFALQAAIWRAAGRDSIVVWQKHRWDMVSPTEPPLTTGASVQVAMMMNEYRNAALNISNCSAAAIDLQLEILGLPRGTNPDYISIHDAPFTDTKKGIPVIAALPQARSNDHYYIFHIEAGMTRQVWMTFHSQNLPAGTYNGHVVIEPGHIQIPIHLAVYPFTFPDRPTQHLGGWDYTDQDRKYDVTVLNRTPLIQNLRDHWVDSPWATSRVMPYGQYDPLGGLIESPDASQFKKWIERWPGIHRYFVFLNVNQRFAQFQVGTPTFKTAVANWISWWVEKLAEWNISPEQLALQLVDEPRSREEDRIIIEYARVIKAVQPKIIIWENPISRDPRECDAELFHLCDILCPKTSDWIEQGKPFADFYDQQRRAGKELWLFSCSAATKLLDPYAYYLMQHWLGWKFGATGSAFWAFGDSNGASSWNEYISLTGAFTPLFLDVDSVNSGKHMEAIREGIEDFEYLRMLYERVHELEKRRVADDAITAAKVLLESGVDRVTACMTQTEMIQWQTSKNRGIADEVRIEVLEMLMKLRGL